MGALSGRERARAHFSRHGSRTQTLLAPEQQQLLQHPLLAAPTRAALLARYFDTPDLHLMRHGAGLRVRKEDGVWMQTMKAGGSVQTACIAAMNGKARSPSMAAAGQADRRRCTLAGRAGGAQLKQRLEAAVPSTSSANLAARLCGQPHRTGARRGHIERMASRCRSTKSNWN
jgi:hypothetical protein